MVTCNSFKEQVEKARREGRTIAIYGYYDIPLTYVKEFNEKYYFFHYIEQLENEDSWLFTEISKEENQDIYNQKLHPTVLLLEKFNNSSLYLLRTSFDNTITHIEKYTEEIYDELDFPDEDVEFDYDYLTQKKLFYQTEEIKTNHVVVNTKEQTTFDFPRTNNEKISFTFEDERNSHFMPLNTLGNIISSINSLFKSISGNSLAAEAIIQGSFGITLVPYKKDIDHIDLFSFESLDKLIFLFKTISNNSAEENSIFIRKFLDEDNGFETIKNLNELLKIVNKQNYTFTLRDQNFNSISRYTHNQYYLTSTIDKILESSEEKIEYNEINAKLVSFNSITGNIKVMLENEIQLSGYLDEEQYVDKVLVTPSDIKVDYVFYPDRKTNKYELISVNNIIYY